MARLPRFVLVGHLQHVIVRDNNRAPIFYERGDYQFYLDKLRQACDKYHCDIHAYVLTSLILFNFYMLLLFKYVLSQIGQGKDVNVLMFQYESKVVKAC